MAVTLTIDGQDASAYGVYPSGTFNYLGAPAVEVPMFSLGGGVRSVRSRVPNYSARDLPIPVAASLDALTVSARKTALSWLNGFLGKDVVVTLNDGTTTAREITGTVLEVPMMPEKTLANPTARGTFRLRCADPSWRRIGTPPLALSTSRIAIPMGTAPIEEWVLELMSSAGTITNVVATIRDRGGATVATLTYTGSITTSQHLEVDSGLGTVRLESAGSFTNVMSAWTGGLPLLDPTLGLTVQLSSSAGTPTGVLRATIRDW